MDYKTISLKMLDTLQQGKKKLGSEARKRMASFVGSQLTGNGAFMDKTGSDDLYYTPFGLMLAFVLQLNINTMLTRQWLDKQNAKVSDLVYCSALVRSRLLCKLLKTGKSGFVLNRLFKTGQSLSHITDYPHGDKYSPYSQFLLLSLREDLGMETLNHREMLASLLLYRVDGGGYSNFRGNSQPSTNATAAALAVKGQLSGYRDHDDVDYLYSSQDANGGFYAGSSAPVPDLLSTATALFLLKCYGIAPRIDAVDFIDAHWLSSGGFCATLLDESCDVEYAFYGLLALGASR